MIHPSIFLAFGLIASANAGCKSDYGTDCLSKSAVGGLSVYMTDGDPCFTFSGSRYCFINTSGNMQSCKCTADCGCGEAAPPPPPPPQCDNSMVPQSFDCDQNKWCASTYEDNGTKHTMCTYCGMSSAKCGQVCQYGLTQADKNEIVNKHNELRRKVAKGQEGRGVGGGQPSASNMFKLSWDEELATIAQRWADQCKGGHDVNRKTTTFSWVGQNYAAKMSSGSTDNKSLSDMVMMWYNEVSDFPGANVASFSENGATGVVGHYTQVAWGQTTKIGCGYVQYKPADSQWYTRVLMCNYGIGGNYAGQEMYKQGAAGSDCPNGNDDGLCL